MTTPSSTPQDATSEALTLKLITQLCVGPSITEAACELLREALNEQYPDLHIDPHTTMMGRPTWELVDNTITSNPARYWTLSTLLARQAILKVPTLCIEGEHFLTQLPLAEPAVHLPVRIVQIANTINILAPVLFQAFKEQVVDFWNSSKGGGPQWHELANTLRNAWNVQEVDGWTEDDCKLARSLYHSPDPADRQSGDTLQRQACLVDVDLLSDGKVSHTHQIFIAVLLGQSKGKTVILSHSFDGYKKFTTQEQLGEYLTTLLYRPPPYERLQWRLYEPAGNFFQNLACTLVTLQIDALTRLTPGMPTAPSDTPLSTLAEQAGLVSPKGPDLVWYQQALPDWLDQASTADRAFYARHLKDLAALNSRNAGKTYQDDIPSIRQYAQDRLKTKIIKDHPDAAELALETLTITVQKQVVWGTFPLPGQVESSTFSLADLALQNLIALPVGNQTLQLQTRKALPAWLTVDYVKTLITHVDIGTTYPALIRSKLIDDPDESLRRRTLYTQHLRIQLPLLALQCKVRKEAGIDERGYRYVAAVMQAESSDRFVDGQAIVMRHLAFVPKRRQSNGQDVVSNMYVIGPQNADAGPCLLYRPLFDPVLLQYPSQANLLYAIAQSHALRDSVVAWLPDSVRGDYTNYVFPSDLPSPWTVADFLVEPDKLWTYSGPMSLGQQALNGNLFSTLFEANAKALVELADRQSVSNAENRWATLKQAGWLIFNAALPFMGRIAGTGAWIWQIVDQVQTWVEAHEHGEQQAQWSALTDVLLNLGMAITLHVATRAQPGTTPSKAELETPRLPAKTAVTVEQLPTRTTDYAPTGHDLPLNTSGAITRTSGSLATLLDSFAIEKPTDLPAVITEEGVYQHLYKREQRYYAQVGARWFEVTLEGDETFVIVDAKQPDRKGPPLLHNARGNWFIDTRLRLHGGGRKGQQKSALEQATLKSSELRAKLAAFENVKKNVQSDLQQAHQAMTATPGTSAQAKFKRQAYMNKLDSHSSDYEDARQQLMTLNVFTPVTDFQQKALSYLKAQLELNEAGIRELQTTFNPALKTVLEQLESPATSTAATRATDAQSVTDMSNAMIKRLDYAQSRFTELRDLAREGLRMIQLNQPRLPGYSSDDLRALQVTLARHLCLAPQSFASEPAAWTLISEIVDRADIAVQTLRDTLQERSESRLDERIETLSSLVEQFQFIDERLQDFPQDYTEHSLTPPIERLRALLREFADRASAELAPLHNEQERRRIRPTPPPSPPRPVKKFIHTRFNGVLIGEPRLTPVGLETEFVDIKSPLTHKIIATFHQKSPGVWAEHIKPASTPPSPVVPTVASSMLNGQALLDQLPAFQTRADEQINKASRTPIGIEYMLHQHAQLLEQANRAIEEALTQDNATESRQPSAVALGKQLYDAAQALYLQSNQQVQKIIKQQPPIISGVEWLKNHKLITFKKTVKRRRLKGEIKDYLDEYTLTDVATQTPLWYAHFHYSTADAPADRFLSARLKTPQEHARGKAADSVRGLTAQQRVAFYRSTISLTQAKRLFFRPERD